MWGEGSWRRRPRLGRRPVNLSKEPGLQPGGREASEGLKQGRDLIQWSLGLRVTLATDVEKRSWAPG